MNTLSPAGVLTHPHNLSFVCSVVCVSSVAHHLGGSNWEAAATGTLGRWTYPESKLAMILFAKVRRDQSWATITVDGRNACLAIAIK